MDREGSQEFPTLKMQGISFLVAWITSDAKTELTEKSSSLKQMQVKLTMFSLQLLLRHTGGQLPEIQHQTGRHSRLGGLSLWNVVEEQFTVRDHGEHSLPTLLHPAGLWDLTERQEHVS